MAASLFSFLAIQLLFVHSFFFLRGDAQVDDYESAVNAAKTDQDTLRHRFVQSFLVGDPSTAIPLVEEYMSNITVANCSWADIDYNDQGTAVWADAMHWYRVQLMAELFRTPNQTFFNSSNLLNVTLCAIDFWLIHDFQNPNWWWNQIGIPQMLSATFLLVGHHLENQTLVEKGVEIMDRADYSQFTGANLVWMAGVSILKGLFVRNDSIVGEAFTAVYRSLVYDNQTTDGIQHDGSFHQHGPQLLAGSYGAALTSELLGLVVFARDTHWDMDETRMALFSNLVLDGQHWMVEGIFFDWNVIGREITRPPGVFTTSFNPNYLAEMGSNRSEDFVNFANQLKGLPYKPLEGHRHYFDSDYFVHKRANFTLAVRMYSARTINAQCINGESLQSQHTADGALGVYYTGAEYTGVFPVWDWRRVPGTTCEQNYDVPLDCENTRVSTPASFVGGVSDGLNGAASQNLVSNNLTMYKHWFVFHNVAVFVGDSMVCTSGNNVFTTLDSRLLAGDVYVATHTPGEEPTLLPTGSHTLALDEVAWLYHDNTAYLFPPQQGGDLVVNNQLANGTWESIGVTIGNVSVMTFESYIDHGADLEGGSYAYYSVFNTEVEAANETYGRVLDEYLLFRGNGSSVGVLYTGGAGSRKLSLQASFPEAWASLELTPQVNITVSQPCFVMLNVSDYGSMEVVASSPVHQGELLVYLSFGAYGEHCHPLSLSSTRVRFELQGGNFLGASSPILECRLNDVLQIFPEM